MENDKSRREDIYNNGMMKIQLNKILTHFLLILTHFFVLYHVFFFFVVPFLLIGKEKIT